MGCGWVTQPRLSIRSARDKQRPARAAERPRLPFGRQASPQSTTAGRVNCENVFSDQFLGGALGNAVGDALGDSLGNALDKSLGATFGVP